MKIRLPWPAKTGHPGAARVRVRLGNAMNFVEANGAKIPALGLGTMTLMDAVCVDTVETALCVGYRHIDTAERYRNESEVGEGLGRGLRAAGLAREAGVLPNNVFYARR